MALSDTAPDQDLDEVEASQPGEPEEAETAAVETDAPPDDGDLPPSAEPDAEDPDAPEDPVALDAEVQPADPDADPPPSDESTETYSPFRYRVDGHEFDVPDVQVSSTGEIRGLTLDAWNQHIRPRLADRGSWQRERQGYERKIAELDPERHPDVIRGREFAQQFEALLQLPPEQLYDTVVALQSQWPVIQARAEAEAYKRQAEAHKGRLDEGETERLVQEWTPRLQDGLRQGLDQTLQELGIADVPGLDRDVLAERLWAVRDRVFFEAKQGDGSGLAPGQIGVDLQFIADYLEPAAKALQATRQRATKAAEVERKNAQATGQKPAKQKPPATVGAKGTPAPSDEIDVTQAKTREDYDRLMAQKYRVPT